MGESHDETASRKLSYLLRHAPGKFGVSLDPEGWADVSEVLTGLMRRGGIHLGRAELESLVAGGDKRRFELSPDGLRIRATHGHSVRVDLALPRVEPPEVLFHGTVPQALAAILREGIRVQKRQHVHLSEAIDMALAVGGRRGQPIVLEIAAARMHCDGFTFHRSSSGVWLTSEVPSAYLRQLA
jgi:putative RNA 2'-phosphotransferase